MSLQVRNSPVELHVRKGISASSCYAEGPGLLADNAGASDPTHFTVHAVDEDGKAVLDCQCEVEIGGPWGTVQTTVTDNSLRSFSELFRICLYVHSELEA